MILLLAALAFLAVTVATFAVVSLWDQRTARARLLRDRLSGTAKTDASDAGSRLRSRRNAQPDPGVRHLPAAFQPRFRIAEGAGAGPR